MLHAASHFQIEEVVDPAAIVEAQESREHFDRNSKWLQANIADVYHNYRGKHICIAGQEVFADDNVHDAIARATAAHPDDAGWFTRYVPMEKMARVYAV